MTLSFGGLVRIASLGILMVIGPRVAAQPGVNDLVTVNVTPSSGTVHAGETIVLAFHFDIAPGWHIYWRNPGQTGVATAIEVTAPEGWKVGEVMWSRPKSIPPIPPGSASGPSYGYENEAVFFVPIRAPRKLETGSVEVKAAVDWLVCKETCLTGSAQPTMSLQTTSEPQVDAVKERKEKKKVDAEDAADTDAVEDTPRDRTAPLVIGKVTFADRELAKTFRQVPGRFRGGKEGHAIAIAADTITLSGPAHGMKTVEFIPDPSPGVTLTAREQSVDTAADTFRIVIGYAVNEANTLGEPPVAGGVVALGDQPTDPAFDLTVSLGEETREGDEDESDEDDQGGGDG